MKIRSKGSDSEQDVNPESKTLPMDFSTFIFSLNSSALVLLGIVEDPESGEKAKNLLAAKQTIDILGMIEKKTMGNLTDDEKRLLRNILRELRILYVKETG
jgi:hypothetical protein